MSSISAKVANFFGFNQSKLKKVPKSVHGIDRRLVSRNAIKVCEVLRSHGHTAFIVGGAVRDLMLGQVPKDFDVTTDATPLEIKPLFRRALIIGKRFKLVHVMFGPEIIETSTFRASGELPEDSDGRILSDNNYGTIETDANRRDFTINAMYYDPIDEIVYDYHNGIRDTKNLQIRMIGEPEKRYREDPVRMLRAIRFAGKLGANIATSTYEPISRLSHLISNVPDSRIFDETFKLLTCGDSLYCIRELRKLKLDKGTLPLLEKVLALESSEKFLQIAFERTDQRVRLNKSINPSYLYAAILWPLVKSHFDTLIKENKQNMFFALQESISEVLEEQLSKLQIQKRHLGPIREIWIMQYRLDNQKPKSFKGVMSSPYFRAACEFMQLRAASNQTDSVKAQWWMDLANASQEEQKSMIDKFIQSTRNHPGLGRKPRRRKKKSNAIIVTENLQSA